MDALDLVGAYDPELAAWMAVPGAVAMIGRQLAKQANEGNHLQPAATLAAATQRPLGGPNPLTATLVGGLVGSGLGYVGGRALESVLPVERGALRKRLAIMGGLGGAIPGAAWGGGNMARPEYTGGGLQAWTSGWPFVPGKQASSLPVTPPPDADGSLPLGDITKTAWDTGAFYVPSIPVDAFNAAVWSDVQRPNPFGTKSPWGTNDQPLGTAPASAAAISGLIAGAGAATGQSMVSPFHLSLLASAARGGVGGYVAGTVAAKALGALAGLTPEAQTALQQTGLWGGIISGIATSIFG